MTITYKACFYKDENKGYSVIFPDLNYLATCGEDINEARKMAVDCLAGYLYIAQAQNETIPPPSKTVFLEEEHIICEGCLIEDISVDVEEYARNNFAECFLSKDTIECIREKILGNL